MKLVLGLGIIGTFLVGVLLLICLGFLFQGTDFFMYRFWAPKYENVRRQVFEQTKSYNQGMIQELQNMQFEYLQTDKEHQKALAYIILHRAADFDEGRLPEDLKDFIHKLREEREQ